MYIKILNKCLRDVPPKLLDNMDEHVKECDPLENHKYFLIKAIVGEYLKVKLFHSGKLLSFELHKKVCTWDKHKNNIIRGTINYLPLFKMYKYYVTGQ